MNENVAGWQFFKIYLKMKIVGIRHGDYSDCFWALHIYIVIKEMNLDNPTINEGLRIGKTNCN
jgi:hypothetical protein